ncbi:matrixin family metalloprotease [Streptomyces aureus]|uniref:matrixin family metalloprotease n=1 Tax=Streptomyces aureus TaxID=193461 RepID=UPI0036813621
MRLIRTLPVAGLSAATAAGLLLSAPTAGAATAPVRPASHTAVEQNVPAGHSKRVVGTEGKVPLTQTTSTSYRFLLPGNPPGRWNPCATLTYKVNLNGVSSAELTRVKSAAAVIASALGGVHLNYGGTTTKIPQDVDDAGGSKTPIVLAFATPGSGKGKSRMLPGGGVAGMGGFYAQSVPNSMAIMRGYAGTAVFDKNHVRTMTTAQRSSLYLHELGHVFGLDHVNYKGSIMYPVDLGVTKLSTGDRTGFRKLGKEAGCLNYAAAVTPSLALSGSSLKVSWPAASATSGVPTYKVTLGLGGGSDLTLRSTTATSATVSLTRLLDSAYSVDPSAPLTVTARVTTSNTVSTKTGRTTSFTLPAAVQTTPATSSFDFTTGELVMTAPRWTVAGLRLPVSWTVEGSVTCEQPNGGRSVSSGYLGMIWGDETTESEYLPTDCESVELAADMAVDAADSTTPVVHLAQTFTRPATTG